MIAANTSLILKTPIFVTLVIQNLFKIPSMAYEQ
jgi:hypothetical protein